MEKKRKRSVRSVSLNQNVTKSLHSRLAITRAVVATSVAVTTSSGGAKPQS